METGSVFSFLQDDGVLIITPLQNVSSMADYDVSADLSAILSALEGAGPHRVVVDFSSVTYFGSSMLEALLRVWHHIRKNGLMVLCGLSDVGAEIVHLAKFDTLWQVYPNRDEAITAVRNAA